MVTTRMGPVTWSGSPRDRTCTGEWMRAAHTVRYRGEGWVFAVQEAGGHGQAGTDGLVDNRLQLRHGGRLHLLVEVQIALVDSVM